ncbi:MAG: hypothetical protein IJE54_04355, partial [Peptococcaceae bacterium]|nr:hypothetical protein [Peptococcaceae bacterium]
MSMKKSAFQNKKPSMRTYIILLIAVFAIAAVASMFIGGGAPADENNTEKMVFQVRAGETANGITARLKEAGLIENEL